MILFFGFPISSYSIQPHATSIGYTKAYTKPSQSILLSCIYRLENLISVKQISIKELSFSKLVNSNSQSGLNSPQNGRPTCTYNHPQNLHQKFVPPLQLIFFSLFHSLLVQKTILTIPTNTNYLYNSAVLKKKFPYFYRVPYLQSPSKTFSLPQPFSQFRLHQGTNEQGSLVRTDTVLISSCFSEVWAKIAVLTTADSLSLRPKKLVYCK